MPVTMIINSTAEGDDEVIWDLDDDFNFIDRSVSFRGERHHLYAGHLLLHEEDLGKVPRSSCARSAIPHHFVCTATERASGPGRSKPCRSW